MNDDGGFTPSIDGQVWQEVRDFTVAAVRRCEGQTAYQTGDLYGAVTKLSTWAWETAGLELAIDVVFRRDVVANYIATGAHEYGPAGRGNLRSQLLRISEILLPESGPRRLAPLPPSDPTRPYSPGQIVVLRSWASSQSTPARRANAEVLLALGLGAGLSASEIGNVRASDLVVDNSGVMVRVTGNRARLVQLLRAWEPALIVRSHTLNPDAFVFRENHTSYYPNLVSNFVNRSQVRTIRPQTQRMRTTWLIGHLAARTPLVPLLEAAGIESLDALGRYIRFLPVVDHGAARRFLRGPNPAF